MKRLTLSEITGIAEIVGSIGIIVSLIFVGLQIRQNTNQVEASSYQAALHFVKAVNEMGNTPQTSSLIRRGFDDFDGLSQDEKVQFDGMLSNLTTDFAIAEQYYYQGTLSAQDYSGIEMLFARVFRAPGAADWWALTKHSFPPWVQQDFDGVIRRYPDVERWSDRLKFVHQTQEGPRGAK